LLIVCGIAVVDIIAHGLSKIAKPGELVFTPIQLCAGGHACNVSLDLVQIGVPKHRISVVFAVGNDVLGDYLQQSLENAGLSPSIQRVEEAPTSKDLILVRRGEDRRFHVDPGANMYLDPEFIMEVLKKQRPTLFYIGGVGMLKRLDDRLVAVLKQAKVLGALTFVDVVAPYKKSWDFLTPALEWVDILHCNDIELKAMMKKDGLEDALLEMRELGVRFSIVTMGKKGLLARLSKTEIVMPSFEVEEIDPTGAGDAFCSGLMLRLFKKLTSNPDIQAMSTEDWKESLLYASACGAACCTDVGTTTSVRPSCINTMLQKQGKTILRTTKISRM
jgi:sugar/nucleoside kinase (ribokinase family)